MIKTAQCLVVLAVTLSSIDSLGRPILDAAGRQRYLVVLDEQFVRGVDTTGEPAARRARDAGLDVYNWHKPSARAAVKLFEKQYGFQTHGMTSYALPSFSAHLSSTAAGALRADPRVKAVIPEDTEQVRYDYWTNRQEGSELIPWGKIAVGADDTYSGSGTTLYLVDGPAMINGTFRAHTDLNIIRFLAPPPLDVYYGMEGNGSRDSLGAGHANHVAGILSARMNNFAVRGVNPGAQIVAIPRGVGPGETGVALDWTLKDAEDHGIFGVVNFSSSFNVDTYPDAAVYLRRFFRRASNRHLIVQSAGNKNADACPYTYWPPSADDGVLVIGGIDEYGARALNFDNGHVGGIPEAGSNYGACVEVWAPSQRIWSTWNTIDVATGLDSIQYLSGTSMAAPHVAALAARYGHSGTMPLEREKYIRAKLFPTGYYAAGAPIMVPSHTVPQSYPIPQKISIAYVHSQSGNAEGGYPSNVFDGMYLQGVWNAGAPSGWITLNLGSARTLTGIRMTPERWPPEGTAVHRVYVGNSPDNLQLAQVIQGEHVILEPIFASLGGVVGSFVRVESDVSGSWLSWREIELYGF